MAAVNAVGMATVGDSKHFWAGPYEQGDEFGGHGFPAKVSSEALALRFKGQPASATATTIAMVATDATLTKAECKRLAIMANDGLARALRPVHAPNDGDTVFAVSTGHAGPGGEPGPHRARRGSGGLPRPFGRARSVRSDGIALRDLAAGLSRGASAG